MRIQNFILFCEEIFELCLETTCIAVSLETIKNEINILRIENFTFA